MNLTKFQPAEARKALKLIEIDAEWQEGQNRGIVTVQEFVGGEPGVKARCECFFMNELGEHLKDEDGNLEGLYLSSKKDYLLKPGGYERPDGLGVVE